MNKLTTTLMGILAIMFFTGTVYAGAFNNTADTNAVVTDLVIAGTNSAALTFIPSPGILIGGITTPTDFTVLAGNVKAAKNAVVVAMTSAVPTIYQIQQDLTGETSGANLTDCPTADADAGSAPGSYIKRN